MDALAPLTANAVLAGLSNAQASIDAGAAIGCIFDDASMVVLEGGASARRTECVVPFDALPAAPRGKTCAVDGVVYRISEVEYDGRGPGALATLTLERTA